MGCLGFLLGLGLSGIAIVFTCGAATPLVIFFWWAYNRDPYPNDPPAGSNNRRP